MKQRSGFIMQRIENTNYVLPYGQNIADHKRGIELNATGAYLWELLENDMPRDTIKSKYIERFSSEADDRSALEGDIDLFLDSLISWGIIEDDSEAPQPSPCAYLKIASLHLSYCGPKELIADTSLNDFCIEPCDRSDLTIELKWGAPHFTENGTVLLRNSELFVMEREKDYLLLFPSFSKINEVSISKDGGKAIFYCKPPVEEDLKEEFFHTLRHVFLYSAKKRGLHAIHSASILYRGKAWLFSAVSGTGKSTHTNLWNKLYGTEVINGDLNLIALENGKPVVHGIPWCGTSGIYNKKTIPLGGIVLLKRSLSDTVEELSPDKKALLVMQRFISPMWIASQLEESVRFSEDLTKKILVCRLNCTKNDSAAEVMKDRIDREF